MSNYTTKNNNLIAPAMQVIQDALQGVSKHIGHTTRWEATKGATGQMPPETHPQILAWLAEAYQRTHHTGISLDYAKKQIEVHYQDSSGNGISINRFLLRTTQLGAVVTTEQRQILAAATNGVPLQQSHKKRTPEEQTIKYLEDSADNSDKAEDFMTWKYAESPATISITRLEKFRRLKNNATDPSKSDYLAKKEIDYIEGDAFVAADGKVNVPLRNAWTITQNDRPSGWQEIHADGTKLFQKGQPTIGQFHPIGELVDSAVVLVCEGFATGQALHKATKLPVAAALSSHNMWAVAADLLSGDPIVQARQVVICPDTGQEEKIAKMVSGLRAVFGRNAVKWCLPDSEKSNYDFDDLAQDVGLEAVNEIIMNSIASRTDPGTTQGKADFIMPVAERMKHRTTSKYFVKGLLYEKSMNAVVAAPMAGKSFLAVDLALCVSAGIDFHGRKVNQSNVLFLAGEGGHGLNARFKAAQIEKGLSETPCGLFSTAGAVDLLDDTAMQETSDFIKENSIGLVIIDTFARSFGRDENSASDVGQAINNIGKYFIQAGAAALIVHHSGHGAKDRARGSSAFRAAMDCEIGVDRTDTGLVMKCYKSKEFEPWQDEHYTLKKIDTGWLDEDGVPINSLVLVPEDYKPEVKLSDSESKAWDYLKSLGKPFTKGDLKGCPAFSKLANQRRAITQLLERLMKAGLIYEQGNAYMVN